MDEDLLFDARLRTLSALSAATVHELRGAASALALHSQLLAMETDEPAGVERRRRSLAIIEVERQRLFAMAELFVRTAVAPQSTSVEFDLAETAATAGGLVRPYAVQRRVCFEVGPCPTAPVVGRRDVVLQAVLDLTIALLDELGSGDGLEIRVEADAGAARLVVAVVGRPLPDLATIGQWTSGLEWAGGELRPEHDRLVIAVPARAAGVRRTGSR
jgi:signal transduction histidine kinase